MGRMVYYDYMGCEVDPPIEVEEQNFQMGDSNMDPTNVGKCECQVNTTGTATGTVNDSSTGTATSFSYTACWHRLPCGYCTIMSRPCPMQTYSVAPNWYSTDVTCVNMSGGVGK